MLNDEIEKKKTSIILKDKKIAIINQKRARAHRGQPPNPHFRL
jgi:hypothetical protein